MQITFDIIRKIERKRQKHKIPVDDLCEEAGIDRTTYQRMLKQETSPRGKTLDAFIEAIARLTTEGGRA